MRETHGRVLDVGTGPGTQAIELAGRGFDVVGIDKTGPIAPFIPMMMFAILFGLSMDYEVFMLARMREAYDETGSTDRAIELGLARTSASSSFSSASMPARMSPSVAANDCSSARRSSPTTRWTTWWRPRPGDSTSMTRCRSGPWWSS